MVIKTMAPCCLQGTLMPMERRQRVGWVFFSFERVQVLSSANKSNGVSYKSV